jgi:hypothetical protein
VRRERKAFDDFLDRIAEDPRLRFALTAGLGLAVVTSLLRRPSTEEKMAAAANDRLARQAARSEYDARWRKARELDRAHWKAFEADAQAQAAFEAEIYVPIDAPPISAPITVARGGPREYWESYTVSYGGAVLVISWHSAGPGSLRFVAPETEYRYEYGWAPDRLTIGECDEAPSALQRRVASFLGAVQAAGHYADQRICVVRKDRREILDRHYASFATARGWLPDRDGEAKRVDHQYYRSGPMR